MSVPKNNSEFFLKHFLAGQICSETQWNSESHFSVLLVLLQNSLSTWYTQVKSWIWSSRKYHAPSKEGVCFAPPSPQEIPNYLINPVDKTKHLFDSLTETAPQFV